MHRRRFRMSVRVVGAGLLVVLSAVIAVAQAVGSSVCGFIVDGEGRALAGVEVVAAAPQLPLDRHARSDAYGRFELRQLPVGVYTVSFDLPGYQWVEIEGLRVSAQTALELRVEMRATSLDETVVLHGGPSLEAFDTRPTLQLSAAELAALPELVSTRIGASDDPTPGRAPSSEQDRSSLSPAVVVDGRPLAGREPPPPASALAGLSLRQPPGRDQGVLQLITRGGEESLRGSVGGELMDDSPGGGRLAPSSARGGQWVGSSSDGLRASLGGPLGPQLWFFTTLGQRRTVAMTSGAADAERLRAGDRRGRHDHLFGRLLWQAKESTVLEGSLWFDRDRDRDDLVDPFIRTGATADFDASRDAATAGMSWQHLARSNLAVAVSGVWSTVRRELRPGAPEALLQDMSSDGRYSDGVGGGVYAGGAGFAAHLRQGDAGWLSMRGEWTVASHHQLRAELTVSRRDVVWRGLADGASGARCIEAHADGIERFDAEIGGWIPLTPSCDSDGDGVADGVEVGGGVGERWQLADDRFELIQWFGADSRRGRRDEVGLTVTERWLPRPDLSVEAGLRLNPWRYDGSAASLRFDPWQMASPHLGVAWDFEGNGRSRAYLRLARQRLAPGPQLTGRLAGFEDLSVWELSEPLAGATEPPTGSTLRRWRPVAPVVVARELEPRTVDGFVAGLETELLSDLVVGANLAWSRLVHDVVDLSFDGGATIVIDNLGSTMVVNPATGEPLDQAAVLPGAERHVRSLTVFARRRLRGGWQLMTALSWRRAEGNLEADAASSWVAADSGLTGDFLTPESLTGARGPLPEDRRWRALAQGSYAWAWGLELGVVVSFESGAPISRLGALGLGRGLDQRFVGGRGDSGRSDKLVRSDLRLAWPVSLAAGELELWLQIANATNGDGAVAVNERWTVRDETAADLDPDAQRTEASWGDPLVVQEPRRLEMGVGYRW